MIKEFVNGRVYVFIDAANILYSQQTLRWKVDYEKLKKYFEKECDLRAIYFYTGRVGENDKQNSFLKKLENFHRILWIKKSPSRTRRRFDIISISKALLMSSKNKVKIMEQDFNWHGKPPNKEEGEKALQELRTLGGKISGE